MAEYDDTLIERFWAKVDRSKGPEECWPWIRSRTKDGYGRACGFARTFVNSHRAAWLISNGEIPSGLYVLHSCDNPPCCNPSHLFLGTQADNNRDKVKKNRQGRIKSTDCHLTKLTEAQVLSIRSLRAAGMTHKAIALSFNTSESNVEFICHRKTWKELL